MDQFKVFEKLVTKDVSIYTIHLYPIKPGLLGWVWVNIPIPIPSTRLPEKVGYIYPNPYPKTRKISGIHLIYFVLKIQKSSKTLEHFKKFIFVIYLFNIMISLVRYNLFYKSKCDFFETIFSINKKLLCGNVQVRFHYM